MNGIAKTRRLFAILLLAVWWGGFTFYALVVVPTGHQVLRSKVRQGFITQQVTNQLNVLGAVTLALLLWQWVAVLKCGVDDWARAGSFRRGWRWGWRRGFSCRCPGLTPVS